MKTKEFFNNVDHDKVVSAITDAEKHTSGEIRVYVSHRSVHDVRHAAAHQFIKLGMDKTKHRNGVLIFVAPRSRNFAILGDTAVHAKCGESFWEQVTAVIREHFQKGDFTSGLVHAIHMAGKLLAEHFPREGLGDDEVSSSVVEGR
jgi:uncharacterized membrane protein